MIALEDRHTLVRNIEAAHAAGARLRPACEEAGITVRTLQRWTAEDGLRIGDRRPEAERPTPAHALTEAERARILRACMAELHADYREALFLVYFEGLSHAETAAVMGRREKQVADLIYRGKIALRKRLEQEGITDAYNG